MYQQTARARQSVFPPISTEKFLGISVNESLGSLLKPIVAPSLKPLAEPTAGGATEEGTRPSSKSESDDELGDIIQMLEAASRVPKVFKAKQEGKGKGMIEGGAHLVQRSIATNGYSKANKKAQAIVG